MLSAYVLVGGLTGLCPHYVPKAKVHKSDLTVGDK